MVLADYVSILALSVIVTPGEFFLVRDYWGCAAGWGRIFTTGLTENGVTFLVELLEWGRKFSEFLG